MTDIKECPMCGGGASFVRCSAGLTGTMGFDKWLSVSCAACGVTVGASDRRFREKEDAAKVWNRRASLPSQPPAPGEVEQAKDAEIEAAYEALQQRRKEAGAALFRSRIGLPCGRCGENVYASDSNGYNTFHRCLGCAHVPFWKDDGTELTP